MYVGLVPCCIHVAAVVGEKLLQCGTEQVSLPSMSQVTVEMKYIYMYFFYERFIKGVYGELGVVHCCIVFQQL